MGTWRCHQPWYLGKRQNEWCTVRTYQFMKQLEYLPCLTAQFLLNELRLLLEEVRRLRANIQEACISTKESGLFKAIPKITESRLLKAPSRPAWSRGAFLGKRRRMGAGLFVILFILHLRGSSNSSHTVYVDASEGTGHRELEGLQI